VGALFAGTRRVGYEEEQQQEMQQQMYTAQRQNDMAQGRSNYERAFGACMSARGYTVR